MSRWPMIRLSATMFALAMLLGACASDTQEDDAVGDTSPDDTGAVEDDGDGEAGAGTADSGDVELLRLPGGDFGYPSPFAWVRGPGYMHASYLFDTLVWKDTNADFVPWLATEWGVSDDGLTWTFTLREDVTWHDGEPLTASDVEFTFDYLTEGPGAETGMGRDLAAVDDVVAQDDTTVVFTLSEPFGPFHENVSSSMLVIPQHVWAEIDDPAAERGDGATLGSGPYTLADADPANGTYRYVANEDYFLGAPVVKELQWVPADDELLALQRGEVDVADIARDPIPDEQLAVLQDDFVEVLGTRDWNLALHFNLDAGFPYDEQPFRAGVAHGIDREDMVARRLFGAGVPGSAGGLSPDHPFFADGLPEYEHDVERANELLDEVGLVDADGDGLRDLPDGSAFRPSILASSRFPAQGPQLVSEYLRGVGIDAQLEIVDQTAADDAAAEGNYTLALVGYGGVLGDADTLRERFASAEPTGSFSYAHGYENERVRELAEEQLRTTDVDERRALIVEMQQEIAADLPVLPLYVPQRRLFASPEVPIDWGYTPGCSNCRGSRNKILFVTGGGTL